MAWANIARLLQHSNNIFSSSKYFGNIAIFQLEYFYNIFQVFCFYVEYVIAPKS